MQSVISNEMNNHIEEIQQITDQTWQQTWQQTDVVSEQMIALQNSVEEIANVANNFISKN